MKDAINPAHYKGATWECIEIIEAYGLGGDHFRATALAYILRASRKNGEEDIAKAVWYLRRLAGSPLNLAAACFPLVGNPHELREMTSKRIAADFGITDRDLICALGKILPARGIYETGPMIMEMTEEAAKHLEDHLRRAYAAKLDAEAAVSSERRAGPPTPREDPL